jgi:hypothetical protein
MSITCNPRECTKCLKWKFHSDFYKDCTNSNGIRPECKECTKADQARRMLDPKKRQQKSIKQKTHYLENHGDMLAKAKLRYIENAEYREKRKVYSRNRYWRRKHDHQGNTHSLQH